MTSTFKTITLFSIFGFILHLYSCTEPSVTDLNSREAVEKLLESDPLNPEALHARAKLHIRNSESDSALIDAIHAIEQDSSKSEYFITLGDIYLIKNQTRFTRQALEKAIKLSPDSKNAHMKLAELFLYVEMRQEAINEINEVLKRDKTNPKAYYLKGIIYKESGDTALAISSFLTTVEQDPNYLLAYEQLGLVFSASGNPRAINFYETAIKLDPKNSLTRYNLGMYYQDNGNPEKAVEVFKELVKLDPAFANAHYNLGYLAIEEDKDYASAIEHFKSAEIANPSYAAAVYMQGVCFEKMNKQSEAVKLYQKSIQIDPRFSLGREGLIRLGAAK
ncbi:MAG: tetratricopeptide repeat protein [Bacteroidia bacterium]